MATLTLIGEPFPGWDSALQAAAAQDLTEAVAVAAPRGCSARLLIAKGTEAPVLESPRARVETLPLKAGMLPVLWQSGASARPLDGEFVHALTPMVPLRSRDDGDGTQTSVAIPHGIAWQAPELMGTTQARLFRSFVRRAVRLADVIVTSTHATASALQEHFGPELAVQVLPLAAPTRIMRPSDAAERRVELELPSTYVVTTAAPGEFGRLDWILDAMRADPSLPALVVLSGSFPAPGDPQNAEGADPKLAAAIPTELQHRVTVVRPRELEDIGAVLSGAELLALPQAGIGTGYELLAALSAGVPALHGGSAVAAELAFEGGIGAEDATAFAGELSRIMRDDAERSRLSVLAEDQSRSYSWASTAWHLWEIHANI
ncbi:glycosyltransferase [Leucobacter iarius]|uniref:Mannosyltransferase n=1 Tax=Leucobacter iarius TaxID=333963 RepID=A0ABN2L9P7_9MICO